MAYRGHEPTPLADFKGLWDQGDPEECPPDHFPDCENIFFNASGNVETRPGVDQYQNVLVPLGNIVRIYNYVTQSKNTLLVLVIDGGDGKIYHVVDAVTAPVLILDITGMTDFGFVAYAGRAYITPFANFATAGGPNIEKGLANEFLYVYLGTGSPAIPAAGAGLGGSLTVANGAAGNTDAGFHLFAVVGETATGYLTPPSAIKGFTTAAAFSVSFSTVPTGPGTIVKRHIVATKKIVGYTGNTTGYTYYFIPGATINDNVTTTLSNISFFDADLLEDASHLFDNYTAIPAGVGLCIYHNRLVLYTTFTDISLLLVSAVGEPEAISQVDGLLVFPPDGFPITNAQELRDTLFVTKRAKTVSFTDNDDVPSSWPLTVIDQGLGTCTHGMATVVDSGVSSVDYLLIATLRGIMIFNGKYMIPELTWKISGFWLRQDFDDFRFIQIVNDTVNQIIYCTLIDRRLLIGDYSNGLNPKEIRWAPERFNFQVSAIALHNISNLLIASFLGIEG